MGKFWYILVILIGLLIVPALGQINEQAAVPEYFLTENTSGICSFSKTDHYQNFLHNTFAVSRVIVEETEGQARQLRNNGYRWKNSVQVYRRGFWETCPVSPADLARQDSHHHKHFSSRKYIYWLRVLIL